MAKKDLETLSRFEQRPTPLLYGSIVVACTAVFISDLFTPLGVAVWIFYLLPMFLSLFLWRPGMPMLVATSITVLMVAGYFLSPPGVNVTIGQINRGMGMVTVWLISGAAREVILNKLRVRKQEWLAAGQTGLGERLRGEQTLQEVSNHVLQFLTEYLQAQAAVLFVHEEGALVRRAGYALPASGVPERVAMGEGLAGQVARQGQILIVNEVPADHFHIRSGLGQSLPRHLLLAPLTANGSVTGVLELAFVHPIYDADLTLLNRLAETIGISIRSALDRTRLQQLLQETQLQAAELQAQSEELRVSNEQLSEQSHALKESQARMEVQQAELEQVNQQLEEQTQALETQTDDLRRTKSELERQARELEQASRYKSDFLASMSHELRTPLNSSLILAKLLSENRSGNLTEEQIKYAQTIESAGNDLLTLITEILDLSKIEAGRMEVKVQAVSTHALVENLARTFQPLAANKRLELRTGIAPGTPANLETDQQKLEQVLKNMLANAVKFTEQGHVSLQLRPAEPGCLALVVEDTGIGIPPAHHELIFEPFRQVDGVANRRSGGTGLGLSITRELVHLLGGRIKLQSEPGRGSVFTVTLPATYDPGKVVPPQERTSALSGPAMQPTAPVPATPPVDRPESPPRPVEDDRAVLTRSRHIALVVEDDEVFARLLRDLAHELGFQCVIASTAEQGVIMARQFAPSAVLLDVGLPDNSGLTVLDRLKRDPRTRHIPVHVISGSDYSLAAREMGAAGYMLKPVKREQLQEAFHQLEDQIHHHVRRVLVVEDDAVQLESLQNLLGTGDVKTVGASSAGECLELLKTTSVDCMVLDLNLPDSSGFELLDTLAREENYPFPPVIIYTGRELTAQEEQRLRRYTKSVIIKGAKSPERLLDEVTLFLHQVISELPPEHQKLLEKAASRDAALERKRILVVEDDVRNVFALTSILEPRGATVQVARNGREALEALDRASHNPARPIHLVLMDIMMPEMDGLTATREIRKRPDCKKLPIIALTAKAMKADQEQCLAAGANDYLPKPLDVEKLLSLVRVWMPR